MSSPRPSPPARPELRSSRAGPAPLVAHPRSSSTGTVSPGNGRTATGRHRRTPSPALLGRLVALLGVVTLVSALVPALRSRLALLTGIVPPVAPAAATAGAAAVGV